jgi:MFS family permease
MASAQAAALTADRRPLKSTVSRSPHRQESAGGTDPLTSSHGMTAAERRAATALAGIFAFRMLGLFMILPVFALYADQLQGHTPFLVGLAIGAYGLTQALLQIPFGMLSDRFGRKRIITAGLLLFAVGSAVAALADSIVWVIVGRALQGSGAVAAAIMALAADLTRDEQRTKAMAMIGMSIGLSFAVALVLGPVLNAHIGVPGIFWLTAGLALGGIALLHLQVPNPVASHMHHDAEPDPDLFGKVLKDRQLLRLDLGILTLHLILTANFVAVPLALRDLLDPAHHWWIYLPVLLFSVAAMVPFIIAAERGGHMKQVFLGAVLVIVLAELALTETLHSLLGIGLTLWLFFTAFNLLEASLPSLISKIAPARAKGTAMGVYSSSQFFGAFLGGAIGGWAHGAYGLEGVFVLGAALALLWLGVAMGMKQPPALKSRLLHVGEIDREQARELTRRLAAVSGVAEAVVVVEDGTAYLKVDSNKLDEAALAEMAIADT